MKTLRIVSALADRVRALRYVFSVTVRDRYGKIHTPWVRVVAEVTRHIKRDDVSLMAAGVAYYAVLSLFPLTLLLLSILRLFIDSEASRANLERFFAVYLPDSVGFVNQIGDQGLTVSGAFGVVGILALLWSGTSLVTALIKSINRSFGIRVDRPLYKDRPMALLLGFGIVIAFAASVFGSAAIEAVSQFHVPVIGQLTWLQNVVRIVPFLVTVSTFTLVYMFAPRNRPHWRNVVFAAFFGATLFEIAKVLFLIYLNRIASFEIYGTMATLVVLMVWSYFSAFVVLVGAELVAVRERLSAATAPDRE